MRVLIQKLSKRHLALLVVAALVSSDLMIGPVRVLCCSVLGSFGSNVLQPNAADIRLLAPNERIDEELSAGSVHSCGITVASGQYARVVVDQWGIDMGLVLYRPGGHKLLEVGFRQNGPTPVSLIADATGTYRLELRALEKDPAVQGRYQLRFEELRQAKASDNSRIAAEKAFAQAEQLRAEWRAESSRKAIEKCKEAARYYRAAGAGSEEAKALESIGEIYQLLGEPRKAIEYYRQGLLVGQREKDHWSEGEILNGIGSVYVQLGENQKALEYCSNALTVSRTLGNHTGEAQALNNLGEVYYSFGDMEKSLEFHSLALGIWRGLNDRRRQAHTLLNLGYGRSDLTEELQALNYYNKAMLLWLAVDDRRGQALTLMALGALQTKLGEKQEALNLLGQARQMIQPMGDPALEAGVLTGMGQVYYDLEEPEKAFEYYNQLFRLSQALSFRSWEGLSLMHMGRCKYSLGDTQKALDYHQRALAVFRGLADQRLASVPLGEIGRIFDSFGDKQKALKYYNQALSLKQSAGERREAAYTLNNIGHVYHELGKKKEALDYYMKALPLSRAAADRHGEALALYNIARTQFDSGNFAEARRQLESALKISESLRTKVDSQELRTSYFASVRQHYDLYIDLLMQMHKEQPGEELAAAALQASERARARSLSESLTEARVDIRHGVEAALLERERLLQQSLSAKADRQMRLLSGKPNKEEAEALAKEIRNLTNEHDQVQAEIKSKSPRYAALTQPQPLNLKQIQEQLLDDNSLLLEYALGDERSYLWAVTPTSMGSYELPGRAVIEKPAQRVRELLIAHQRRVGETAKQHHTRVSEAAAKYAREAATLSQILLGPVADQLRTKRLLIVAEGALQYLPFGALPKPEPPGEAEKTKGERPLILDHEVISLPSASVLAMLRREIRHKQASSKAVAVLADPVFETDDSRLPPKIVTRLKAEQARKPKVNGNGKPRASSFFLQTSPHTGPVSRRLSARPPEVQTLPDVGSVRDGLSFSRLLFSQQEAEAIIAVAPPGQGMMATGFNASRALATSSELSQYRFVHFATHGVVNDQHPGLSGIVLSLVDEQGRPLDGLLRLNDIYNLNLRADLVVLSACNTALGKEVRGEGLVGIVRGFMYAGATRVVASLWQVDDEATAELMKRFYRNMLQNNMPAAAALRAAQIEMSEQKQWRSPYYWAAFVLQGEWK